MPVFERGTIRVLFVHIPKTGGSSLEQGLRNAGFRQTCWSREKTAYGCSPQHLHAEALRQTFDMSSFDLMFTVIRDPVDRVVSEFNMRHPARSGEDYGDEKFRAWFAWCRKSMGTRPWTLDNHIRPQVDFMVPECRVFRFEEGLDNVLRFVLATVTMSDAVCSLSPQISHLLKSHGGLSRSDLGEESLDSIFQAYREDYAHFGYQRPSRQDLKLPTRSAGNSSLLPR